MSVERLHQDRTFVGSAGPRARTAPTTPPTHSPSDTEAASATTCQLTGITTRAQCGDYDHRPGCHGHAPRGPGSMLCQQGAKHRPEDAEPDHGRSEHRNQPGECCSVTGSGPRTKTLATGTAVATSKAAPRLASMIDLRADLIQHLGYRGGSLLGRSREPGKGDLEQRSNQDRVREEIDRVGPREAGQCPPDRPSAAPTS